MFHSRFYVGSSPRIQEMLISARAHLRRSLREGGRYHKLLADSFDREFWNEQELQAFQGQELRLLLQHARQFVPYYSELFQRIGFDPACLDIQSSINQIPLLTKQDVLAATNTLIAKSYSGLRIRASTSGTTGTPLIIYQDLAAVNREQAFIARQLAWAGYREAEPRAWLRGEMVVPAGNLDPPYWRLNRAEKILMMSSYHLSEATGTAYLKALRAFDPSVMQAYPSSIAFLARYLESHNNFYQGSRLRSIVTSSETLSDQDRTVIEERFRCRIFDWYGSVERVAAIGTCEKGAYHLINDYSYVEFLPAGDGLYEVVGTGFSNRLMPLIRYRTGDLVELDDSAEGCTCGRAFLLVKRIYGRQDDYVKLEDGRRIGRMDHIFKGLKGIAEAQIVQDEIGAIRILVVPIGELSNAQELTLRQNAHDRLGPSTRVSIEIVLNIERTKNGKFRSVVCNA